MPFYLVNPFGICVLVLMMIPNIIMLFKDRDGFKNRYKNKLLIILENISRIACFVTMCINLYPVAEVFRDERAFSLFREAFLPVYMIGTVVFLTAYISLFFLLWKKNSFAKAFWLSVLPCLIFFVEGLYVFDIPLLVSVIVFASCHITLSLKNQALAAEEMKKSL